MDAPKREVSWLESFPPDIWAYFACYLCGEQLERLALTGSTLLRQRLKSPKVVKSIILGEDFVNFKSVPTFLKDFPSLEKLQFHLPRDEWSSEIDSTFASIPSGVRKLELIEFGFAPKKRTCWFDKPGAILNISKYLPHLESLHLNCLEIPDYSWMAYSPQSLTKLRIEEWTGKVELPSSLIHFGAFRARLSTPQRPSTVSKLPSSLETLVLPTLEGVDLLIPLLPPSLRTLSFGRQPTYSDGCRSPQSPLENLPKTLTWFKVPISTQINFETSPELTCLLPSTLTELDIIPPFPCSAWQLLPPHLTKLSIKSEESLCTVISNITVNGRQHQARSIPFETLPRSITRLTLVSSYDTHYPCIPSNVPSHLYFPPQLNYLSIAGIQLVIETVKLLPSSLTYLEVRSICEKVCQHLPANLKTLISAGTLMSPNLIQFLPKKLTSLSLGFAGQYDCWLDCNTGKIIWPITVLAEYSIHEKCMSSSFDWKDSAPLPPTLRQFSFTNVGVQLGESFLRRQHLPNLTSMNFESKHVSDFHIRLLSPCLTHLDLAYAKNVSGKSFDALSRSLTSLNLNSAESIFDCDIQHLPRALITIYFGSAIHLTDLCISELPPRLETFSVPRSDQITSSRLPKLRSPVRFSEVYTAHSEFQIWDVDG